MPSTLYLLYFPIFFLLSICHHLAYHYDLNHISYDYTVEVTNRFKGLYLIEYLRTMDRGL